MTSMTAVMLVGAACALGLARYARLRPGELAAPHELAGAHAA
jgi:hypothetical protein